MRIFTRFFMATACWLAFSPSSNAQYNSPTLDGNITAGEYGDHSNGVNQQTSSSITWFMTWDATNLYFAVSGYTNDNDALNVYLDTNPATVVNGGTGSTTGANYDGVQPTLPFSGDWFFYVKAGYEDVVQYTGGSWINQGGLFVDKFYNDGGDILECRVAWSTIGGKPAAMNWHGCLSYSTGTFSPVPNANPAGGGSPANVRYYTLANLDDGTVFHPFTKESYTHTGGSVSDFGAISVFDFTMNTAAATITRAATGAWEIGNRLTINEGAVSFGACSSGCSAGSLVHVKQNGTLSLSTAVGGDLTLNGPSTELKIDGIFSCQNRAVNFLGGSGAISTLSGDASTIVIDYLKIDLETFLLEADRNFTIDNELRFENLGLQMGSNTLTLNSGASIVCPPGGCNASHSIGLGAGGHVKKGVNAPGYFELPITFDFFTDMTQASSTVNSLTGSGFLDFSATGSKHPDNESTDDYLDMFWTVTKDAGITAINYDIHLKYPTDEVVGNEWPMYGAKTTNGGWQSLGPVDDQTHNLEGFGLTQFSDFTAGQAAVLPLEWLSFSVEKMGDETSHAARLRWSVANQIGNRFFEIERLAAGQAGSPDGSDWFEIGQLAGDFNLFEEKTFEFTDSNPLAGLNFYRIRQTDFDGKSTLSAVRVIDFSDENRVAAMAIFPNPAADEALLFLKMKDAAAAEIRLFDETGRLVFQQKIGLEKGENRLPVDASKLASGIFLCLVLSENGAILGQARLVVD